MQDVRYHDLRPVLERVCRFVAAHPGVPRRFRAKYELLADPERGVKRLRLLRFELDVAGCSPSGRVVLDAGCGSGLYSVLFSLLGASRVEAVDFFPDNVENPSRIAGEFGLPIEARLADIANTPLRAGSVGLVYCTEAISHFHDWVAFCGEAARVLEPRGRVIIADGNNGANPRVRRAILDFWERSEHGPFAAADSRPRASLPYPFRRWMIIRRRLPHALDEEVYQLGLLTSRLGGEALAEACREFAATGRMPRGAYRRGQSRARPGDGQRNEEPLDPFEVAAYLRGRGLGARARAHFGFGRSPLFPALNALASRFGRWPLRFAERYLVLAGKPGRLGCGEGGRAVPA